MRLAIIDLETTGLDPLKHEIIEVGIVLCDSAPPFGNIVSTVDFKVKPEHPETGEPKAFEVNGYSAKKWKDACSLKEAMEAVAMHCEGYTMMSFNISFDYGFLSAAFNQTGVRETMTRHKLDLLTLAWAHIPQHKVSSWKLKFVCAALGIEPEPAVHRGANGAMKAYEVYKKLASMP